MGKNFVSMFCKVNLLFFMLESNEIVWIILLKKKKKRNICFYLVLELR